MGFLNSHFVFCSVLLVSLVSVCSAFYLPGVAVKEYADGETVKLKVNKLTSGNLLPHPYYELPFCQPSEIVDDAENLGEVLAGDVIENSPYMLHMAEEVKCKILCRTIPDQKDVDAFVSKIEDDYEVNWIVDNLPASTIQVMEDGALTEDFSGGFLMGGTLLDTTGLKDTEYFVNNHHILNVFYHESDDGSFNGKRIVGFSVEPFSVKHKYNGEWNEKMNSPPSGTLLSCNPSSGHLPQHVFDGEYEQPLAVGQEILWTYDVEWQPSEVKWASRWDVYLQQGSGSDSVHWFAISNSFLVVVLLSGVLLQLLLRALNKDVEEYNVDEEERDAVRDESGWKLVHGDVFRPPPHPLLFSVAVGSGAQLLGMCVCTILLAAVGFLSPANRGSTLTALMVLFVLCGVVAGYSSSRSYRSFGGHQWQKCTLLTATLLPGLAFTLFFLLNLLVWAEGGSGAVPFPTMLGLMALWFCVSVPLTFAGAYLGYRREVSPPPTRVKAMPRQVPPQGWQYSPLCMAPAAGVLPFGAVFIELYFIFNSMWQEQYYFVFGFLMLVLLILLLTAAEITVLFTYLRLSNEDYRWHWRALLEGGSVALYVLGYSVHYYNNNLLHSNSIAALLYFGYMSLLSLGLGLAVGVTCYWATLRVVSYMFSAIKVD